MKMSTKERDLVGRLLKQSILTVCKEAVSYNHQLEIDGIICISLENEEKEIVVKVHELFKKNFDNKTNYKNNESNEIKSQQQMLNGNIAEQEIKVEEIRPEDDYTGVKRHETFNDFGNSTGFDLNDEESDSSNSEEMEDMDVIPNNDDSQVTTSTVIKKPIVNRILTSKFPINKLARSLLKQTSANHDEKDKSTKTDDDDMPGYIYNSEAPKPDIKPVRDVECKRCLCILPDGPSFESHNLNQHNVYTCLVCYNTFTCRNNMKRHMRLHTGYKPYQCTLCSESFTRKDDIKRHLIKHNYSKPFRCNLCDKGYMDRKTIKNHMKKEHSTKLLHCCPTCGESFNDGAKFLKHKKSHPELMVYQCSICNFSGSSPLMYNKHMLIHGQEKSFSCVPCGSVFNDPFRYTSHLKKHRSDDSFESYLCCFCSHCLPTYDQLIKHEHTHVQCKRHTCTVCMKQFRYPSNLREHMLIHSDMSKKIKVHIKKEVLLSTLNNNTLVNEENEKLDAAVTKIENGSTDEGIDQISSQYWCTECQKGFESEDDLTKHISSTHDEFSTKRQEDNICTSTSDEAGHFIEAHNDDEDMEASSSDNEEEEFKIPKLVKEVNISPPTQDNIYSLLPTIIKPENGLMDEHMNKTGSEDEDLESELSDSLDHTSSNSSSVSPSLPVSEIPSPAPSMPVFPQNEQDNLMKVMPSTIIPSTNISNNLNSTTRSPGFERVVTPEVLFRTKEPFECDICKGSFDDFDIFDRHCNSVHRRYICEFCGKQFTSKPNRDRHVRYHTGEKPYKCELCNQSFFRGDDLKYHRTTRHSDIKPFSCSKCRMTFAWAKDLERHLKNVDECLDPRKNLCPGECINVPGSFYCNCSIPGYEPSHTDKFCNDVDECTQNNGDCQEHCKNTLGSYECSCRKGLVLTKDLHNCTDINECEEYGPHICKNGDCINRYGVYQCMCYHGYQQHKDGIHCTDLNECMHNNGGCQDVCVNTIGSYHCDCSWPGYKITARTECTDIDECSSDNGGCQDVCVNTYGAFYCLCNQPGFVVHVNGRNCSICQTHEYIDEEKKVCVDCPQNSSVLNYTASSVADCFCNSGYHGNPAQNIPCQDIDECEQNLLNCSEGCQNIPGSAFCTCPDGFYLKKDGMNCNDTDECRFKQGGCQGECHNTVGSYYCTCFQGYQLDSDNHTCLDLDECWLNGHNCSHHCTNHDGWAECSCFKGYRLQADQKSCQDINECEEFGNVFCEDTCVNTEGSYKCLCTDKGYKLSWDGASCSDINECMEGENNCQDVCINMLGSFKCDCNQVGFALSADGHTCLDIDECQSPETNKCEHTCVNLPGTFMCQCNPGYVRAGHFHCEACSVGYYSNYSAPLCKRCPLLSTTKTKASVSIADCHCMEGFYGNLAAGEQCSDINECEGDDNFGCEHNCYNTHGSANCGCQDGYKLHENGKNCTDIDECVFSHHYCIDKCINLPGTYKCGCREGFVIRYDGRYCNDVNECAFDNPCEDWCENTWGSYTCECRHPGQKVAPDGISCIDSVEKIQCPKDVFVEIRHEKNFAVVTLPSMISSDHVKVTPEWVKSGAAFPVGTTVITLTSVHDLIPNNTCVFNVHILQICGEGTYKASNSTRFETICLKCPVGTYQNEQGQTECKNCFVGTFQNETGQHQCKYCMPGTFQNSTKQAACIPCQAGTYQDESGQHRCKSCHMGTYNRRMRESACYYCSAGTFQDEYGQSECKPCIPGMYQDDLGQTWCKQCPSDPSLYPYNEEITKQCPSVVQ